MFARVRHIIETRFGLLVAVSFAIGLLTPGLEHTPDEVISLAIALIIFLACFRIDPKNLGETSPKKLLAFYLARFVFLPIPLFYLSNIFFPELSNAVLLLTVMPAGVMSPAMTGLVGGNAAISLGLVLVSSLLCPFIVPLLFSVLLDESVRIDSLALFFSLSCVVFIPTVLHLPFRREGKLRAAIDRNNTFGTMLLLGISVALVAARQRDILKYDPSIVVNQLLVLFLLFALYYVLPWLVLHRFHFRSRVACTLSSGANNSLLALGVALLHFSPETALFMVLSEIPWLTCLSLYQSFVRKKNGSEHGGSPPLV